MKQPIKFVVELRLFSQNSHNLPPNHFCTRSPLIRPPDNTSDKFHSHTWRGQLPVFIYRLISVTITEDDMQKSPFTKILSFVVKAQHGLSVTHSTKHRNGLKHSWKIQLRFFVDTLKSSKPDQKPTIFPTQPSQNTRTEAFLLTFFCAETMEAMQYVIPLRTKTVWKSRLWLCLKHQTSLMFVPSTSKSKSSYKRDGLQESSEGN